MSFCVLLKTCPLEDEFYKNELSIHFEYLEIGAPNNFSSVAPVLSLSLSMLQHIASNNDDSIKSQYSYEYSTIPYKIYATLNMVPPQLFSAKDKRMISNSSLFFHNILHASPLMVG